MNLYSFVFLNDQNILFCVFVYINGICDLMVMNDLVLAPSLISYLWYLCYWVTFWCLLQFATLWLTCFYQLLLEISFLKKLNIAPYHQVKTLISFWVYAGSNVKFLIQWRECSPIELTGTYREFICLWIGNDYIK